MWYSIYKTSYCSILLTSEVPRAAGMILRHTFYLFLVFFVPSVWFVCFKTLTCWCRGGGELSTRDLQKIVQALPQYSDQIDKLSLHVEVMFAKLWIFNMIYCFFSFSFLDEVHMIVSDTCTDCRENKQHN